MQIHVVSFASEGPPHDAGLPLGEIILEEWGKMCLKGGANTYKGYTPRIIIQENPNDAWSVQRYSDEHWMHMYHTVGLGGWRSIIFNKAVKSATDGDVVVVHCSNFPKYPCMKYFASRLREYVESTMSFTDFFMPPHDRVGNYCAKEVLELIPESDLREIVAHAPMGRGRLIIAKVNSRTRRFSQLWEDVLRKNPLLLSSFGKTGYPGGSYHHHTAEQSVINALAFREGMFPRDWRNSWMNSLSNVGHMPSCGTDTVIRYSKSLRTGILPPQYDGKIHVVSFASEGPPYDEGLALGQVLLQEWGNLCLRGGANTYKGYTPRSIIQENPEDAWCVQPYSDEHSVHHNNHGYHKVGLGGWRAVIFNKAVKSARDGDIVMVHCSNFHKWPCFKFFASRLKEYVISTMKFTNLYAPPHVSVGAYCAREILDLIPDKEVRDSIIKAPMGRGRMFITRVNSETRRFAELFEQTLKKDPLLLSPVDKTGYPGAPYDHHTAEQAVFNVLAFREGLFPVDWENSWMFHLRNVGDTWGCDPNKVIKYALDLDD